MPVENRKHILIVGAGPGGLTAGMLLAHRGFRAIAVDLPAHGRSEGDPLASIEEMARAAKARGYRYLCLTDHSHNLRDGRLEAELGGDMGWRERYWRWGQRPDCPYLALYVALRSWPSREEIARPDLFRRWNAHGVDNVDELFDDAFLGILEGNLL